MHSILFFASCLRRHTLLATRSSRRQGQKDGGIIIEFAFAAVSWTQAQTYDNVSISVNVDNSPAPGTVAGTPGNAYLMTAIGPGTTTASEVASTVFTFPPSPSSGLTSLFSGLDLPAGTYYLVLGVSSTQNYGTWWWASTAPTTTLGPGVSGVTDYDAGSAGLDYSFNPNSPFVSFPGYFGALNLSITGSSPVPEPSSVPVGVLALALLFLLSRQRARMTPPRS